MIKTVDTFFQKIDQWEEELTLLRTYLLDCNLVETLKWGQPCYMYNKTNIIILGGFKEYCVLSFIKGALLLDSKKLLELPGENSRSGRVFKFKKAKEIREQEEVIKQYIYEAIEIEKAGLKVPLQAISDEEFVEELIERLEIEDAFTEAFNALTPGKKRGYNIYFSGTKNAETRKGRIEQCQAKIIEGKGLNDCMCGLSKKYPRCDGSHKSIGRKNNF